MKKLLCILFVGLIQFSLASEHDIDVDASYEVKGLVKPAEIIVDKWGVPHIIGRTSTDTAYGLGFANAEDDFITIQNTVLKSRGRFASVYGPGKDKINAIS